jgi:hypothetical protein
VKLKSQATANCTILLHYSDLSLTPIACGAGEESVFSEVQVLGLRWKLSDPEIDYMYENGPEHEMMHTRTNCTFVAFLRTLHKLYKNCKIALFRTFKLIIGL